MKLNAYAIYDLVAQNFNRPYFLKTDAQATRSFSDEVNRPSEDNSLYKHPNDYQLFRLGEFDDDTGLIVPETHPVMVVSAASLTAKE